ncbi:MAG: hypothetical protein M9894_17180 [Planctomycetes bacterium]|nr:hypothetical protein [Planctomycetota bacterium]
MRTVGLRLNDEDHARLRQLAESLALPEGSLARLLVRHALGQVQERGLAALQGATAR